MTLKKAVLIFIAVVLTLISCGLGIAILNQGSETPETPGPAPVISTVPAVLDLGSGTPDAGCASNRRGKTFVLDGVTYVCSGPKPFTWKSVEPNRTRKATKTRSVTPDPEPTEVSFANCDEARDAGAAPIRKGEPGYSRKLDRDGDGIACDK